MYCRQMHISGRLINSIYSAIEGRTSIRRSHGVGVTKVRTNTGVFERLYSKGWLCTNLVDRHRDFASTVRAPKPNISQHHVDREGKTIRVEGADT